MKKEDAFLNKLREKQLEVSFIPTQNLGVFRPIYKTLTPFLKESTWKILAILAIFTAIFIKIGLGVSLTKLTSILQTGF